MMSGIAAANLVADGEREAGLPSANKWPDGIPARSQRGPAFACRIQALTMRTTTLQAKCRPRAANSVDARCRM